MLDTDTESKESVNIKNIFDLMMTNDDIINIKIHTNKIEYTIDNNIVDIILDIDNTDIINLAETLLKNTTKIASKQIINYKNIPIYVTYVNATSVCDILNSIIEVRKLKRRVS